MNAFYYKLSVRGAYCVKKLAPGSVLCQLTNASQLETILIKCPKYPYLLSHDATLATDFKTASKRV